ncbi:MAG: multidrug ABC transporter ATP-binding protein [Chloroflexi bacterium]|nr:MAG: multidrug ABC transporter ATP-binding protein [Chloroflexota bacterium]
MRTVITAEHLHKEYGSTVAVADVSLEVYEDEIFGIIGPNGAGKTTTVECLQGLRTPDSGRMRVLGFDPVTQSGELRKQIGSQLQQSALPDRIRVREALDLFAAFTTHPIDSATLIEQWGLAGRRNAAFGDLSGGQKQRLFIALAFVNDPQLVFLDELTQGLDPQARRATWGLIREIRDRGKTVVLVTHLMEEAEALCDRVAIIDRGRVVALDTPQGLIAGLDVPVTVHFSLAEQELPDLSAVAGVQRVGRSGNRVEVQGTGPVLALVAAELVAHGIAPADLRVERPTLEDAFIALTSRSKRE